MSKRPKPPQQTNPPADKSAMLTSVATAILAVTSIATVWILANQLAEMHLDQRAWLGVVKVDSFKFVPSKDFSIVFDMANNGKTPALHVTTKTMAKSVEKETSFSAEYPVKQVTVVSNSVVQPQQHMALSTLPMEVSDAAYNDLRNGRGILYAYGKITYDDIYNHAHETTFCLMYYGDLPGPITCPTYNYAN